MAPFRHSYLGALAAVAVLAACSFLLNFDPAGQPCGPRGSCLRGYTCIGGKCEVTPACAPGYARNAGDVCVPAACAQVICPVGAACRVADAGGTGVCSPVTDAALLGSTCSSDTQCGKGRVCLRGAVQAAGSPGALGAGVCVEPCTPGTTCTGPEQATCQTFGLGLDAGAPSFCLPSTVATPCLTDPDCSAQGLVCAVYDHPVLGPATFCDTPLAGGAPGGAPCASVASTGPSLCANGLCLPEYAGLGQAAACAIPCAASTDCPMGTRCSTAETLGPGGVLRHVPVCLAQLTACSDCTATGASSCAADAPHCVPMQTASRCLSECSLASGEAPPCPPGLTCTALAGGQSVCLPPASGTACQ